MDYRLMLVISQLLHSSASLKEIALNFGMNKMTEDELKQELYIIGTRILGITTHLKDSNPDESKR